MPTGYRSIIAALGLAALTTAFGIGVALAGGEQQHQQAEIGKQAPREYRNHPQQSDTHHAGVPGFAERLISNPEPSDGTEREKRDLAAQENTAAWAFWVASLSLGQFLLSGVGLLALIITIRQGREANVISRDASRAWLSIIVSETGKFRLSSDKLEFHFDVILENHGESPGLNAFCKGFIVLGSPRDYKLPGLDKIAPSKSTDAECVFFPNSKPMGTEIVAELDGQFPERSEINLVVACRYKIAGHDDWRGSTRTFQLRQDVEFYTSSGRFRNGVCELRIAENAGETIDLNLKERNDCPPTAT